MDNNSDLLKSLIDEYGGFAVVTTALSMFGVLRAQQTGGTIKDEMDKALGDLILNLSLHGVQFSKIGAEAK